ncbi:hypothetical protein K466DRAFT_144004 [Polyporus arcularius HHB13444]|uniref:Uncharacterized protein n=1 Tax=Polyporus arcularius HHB13444 TaxID=1314778 RepID=A0A5C3PA89_9APHY|nr:hypothetical protein K466DRAFT_144004 [Polyporus arcularius HHB13444]
MATLAIHAYLFSAGSISPDLRCLVPTCDTAHRSRDNVNVLSMVLSIMYANCFVRRMFMVWVRETTHTKYRPESSHTMYIRV